MRNLAPAPPGSLDALLDGRPLSKRRSLSADVVDLLRSALVRRIFAPGQHLNEAMLATKLGVSRGPIREAFAQLEREGLLTIERHRGARVSILSQADIDEIYELRVAIERLAVERAARFATDADFAELAEIVAGIARAVERGDVEIVVTYDVRFHDRLYLAARHSRLYANWSNLRPQIETFLHSRSTDVGDYLDKAAREHAELLAVLRSRVEADVRRLTESHIRSAYDRLSRLSR